MRFTINRSYYKYNFLLLGTVLFLSATTSLFNLIADPYGVFNSPRLKGLNQVKPKQDDKVLLFKLAEVSRLKPETVFIGSSTVMRGLDPMHPVFAQRNDVYNLGVFAPHMDDVSRLLDHTITHQPELKKVIIGLDFFMFNGSSKKELETDKPMSNPGDWANILFSINAINASRETVTANLEHQSNATAYVKGLRYSVIDPASFKANPMQQRFEQVVGNYFENPAFYKDFYLSDDLLAVLENVIETCRQHDIELQLFISPIHASQLEAIYASGLWPAFEQWKREVSRMAPVWDFSGYDSISTETIHNQMQNFSDSAHYRKEVGDLILNRLSDYNVKNNPKDFGTLVTAQTIDAHLAQIRSQQIVWRANNPELVQRIQEVYEQSQDSSNP